VIARQDQLNALIEKLDVLHADLVAQEQRFKTELKQVDPGYRESALNLHRYLALRRQDVRPLQSELAEFGLSSLGRSEACVLHSVETVRSVVSHLAGRSETETEAPSTTLTYSVGRKLLQTHTVALLGSAPAKRDVHIMVTMPSEAGSDPLFVRELVASGMDCMRINCAHDDSEVWSRMIANLRRAEVELGRTCTVMMDLGGPKLRTGPMEPGPRVLKIRPTRDHFGKVTQPARLWLTSSENPAAVPISGSIVLPCSEAWLSGLSSGDSVHFIDARGARRKIQITDRVNDACWADCFESAYVTPGAILRRKGDKRSVFGQIGDLPPVAGFIDIVDGDIVELTRSLDPGSAARYDEHQRLVANAHIGCTLPEAFEAAKVGEPIWFDDGKIGGVIIESDSEMIRVEIVQCRPGGSRLRAEKGINLPESRLHVPALTSKDREDLQFIGEHADIVGFSFVSEASDVRELQKCLAECCNRQVGIVLKIETRRAFANLPNLLLAAMRSPSAGIMIARGDLAIECGYERLAEVQEEILWIAEAAHLPVIWATQVLESLAKTGVPSRSEITDAAMGQRAECVMLNKGPYVIEAIKLLDRILRRMQAHQSKKRSLLRQLHSWNKEPLTI